METNYSNQEQRRITASVDFNCKMDNLYKFLAQGWSMAMAEAKAGLRPSMKDYSLYKSSEHYNRVRAMYAKNRR